MEKVVGAEKLFDFVGKIHRIVSDCSSEQLCTNRELLNRMNRLDPDTHRETINCFMHRSEFTCEHKSILS